MPAGTASPDELVALIEGLSLTPPRPSVATITRQVAPALRHRLRRVAGPWIADGCPSNNRLAAKP
jgi:hypothetical protein